MTKNTTRRAVFTAAPIAALMAAPAFAGPGGSEDEELIRLSKEWSRTCAEQEAIWDEMEELDETAKAQYPPLQPALYRRPDDRCWYALHDPRDPVGSWAAEEWRQALARPWSVTSAEEIERIHARAREIVEAWEAHETAKAQVRARLGEPRLKERDREARRRMDEIEARSMELRAMTKEGLAFKAQIFERHTDLGDPENYDAKLFASLKRDLLPGA